MSDRRAEIRNAYRQTGSHASFYDGMMTYTFISSLPHDLYHPAPSRFGLPAEREQVRPFGRLSEYHFDRRAAHDPILADLKGAYRTSYFKSILHRPS